MEDSAVDVEMEEILSDLEHVNEERQRKEEELKKIVFHE